MTIRYINMFRALIQHKESEVVEFKKAENNFDFDDLGKYFSALSNEANLRGLDFAWLVFGYDEKRHEIVGTSYKNGEGALNNLKHDFSQHTTDGQTFREIIPVEVDGKRILMFKIPASPRNIVMKWKGIAYGRDGESLKPLNQSKQDEIRRQTPAPDWSAEIVPDAAIDDLDEVAIKPIRPKTAIIRPFLSHPTGISVGCVLISRNPTVFECKNWKIWTIIQMASQTVSHFLISSLWGDF